MSSPVIVRKTTSPITRKFTSVGLINRSNDDSVKAPEFASPLAQIPKIPVPATDRECSVLVVNASREMAKEITLQLTIAIPGCSIMFSPTIELAKWMIGRRKIDLVVSSALLPDGSVAKLKGALGSLPKPPDLVVVGHVGAKNQDILLDSKYEISTVKTLGKEKRATKPHVAPRPAAQEEPTLDQAIRTLGADIRNDLNNPLQEIVAMVFVAQAGTGTESSATTQALEAIDKAAKNMASVVKSLEEKIARTVGAA